jgi:hypothetical protein
VHPEARPNRNAFRDDEVPDGWLRVSPDGAWLISVRNDDSLVVLEPAAWTSITLRGAAVLLDDLPRDPRDLAARLH